MKTCIIAFLIILLIVISGCSSSTGDKLQNRLGDRQFQPDRPMNLTEEERQQMFGERQQIAIEACEGKNEGDNCQLESPRGDTEGNCKIMEEDLLCVTDRPMVQRQR